MDPGNLKRAGHPNGDTRRRVIGIIKIMSTDMKKGATTIKGAGNMMMSAGELFAKVMDSEAAHTSFGKLPLAAEKSAAQYCTRSLVYISQLLELARGLM